MGHLRSMEERIRRMKKVLLFERKVRQACNRGVRWFFFFLHLRCPFTDLIYFALQKEKKRKEANMWRNRSAVGAG